MNLLRQITSKIRESNFEFLQDSSILKNENRQKFILEVFIAFIVIGFCSLWLFNTVAINDGWGILSVKLIERGQVPYRDFFYNVPPLTLLIDFIFWKLSFGTLVIYRLFRVIERAIIFILLFRFLSRKFNLYISFASVVLSFVFIMETTYDLFGGYNQTQFLLGIIFTMFADNFIISNEIKQKTKNLFFLGIVLGLMFLTKQTVFVSFFIFGLLGLSIICFMQKDKNYIKYVLIAMLGCFIPIIITTIVLFANGAFFQFIDQVFVDVGGKGSLFEILIYRPLYGFKRLDLMFFVVILILCYFFSKSCEAKILIQENNKHLFYVKIFVICFTVWLFTLIIPSYTSLIIKNKLFTVLFFTPYCLYLIFTFYLFKNKKYNVNKFNSIAIFCFLIYGALLCVVNPDIAKSVFSYFYLYNLMLHIGFAFFYACIIALFYYLHKKDYVTFLTLVCAVAIFYAMNYGVDKGNLGRRGELLIVPYFIALIFQRLNDNSYMKYLFYLKNIIITLFLIISFVGVSQKLVSSYTWWTEPEKSFWEKTETTDIPFLKFIKLSPDKKELYETVNDLIIENSTENDFIFTYPRANIFNIISNRYAFSDFVPVLWFDVVGDKAVEKELALLKENLPEIVIWEHVPHAIEIHEKLFRQGRALKQRELESWFDEIKYTDYRLLTKIGNISVYKKLLGNETIKTICDFDGCGTINEPFLIQNTEDVVMLSKKVNAGEKFEGRYFLQTTDIDLNGVNFESIGKYGTDNVFCGIYDGGGYSISNLHTVIEDKKASETNNNALFGQLGGTVINLGIENGVVEGDYCGSIASHAYGSNAKIVNCYNKATVRGKRAGGIADNFNGMIIGCWTDCKLEGDMTGGIVSYNGTIKYCYAKNLTDKDKELGVKGYNDENQLSEKLNKNLIAV